MKKKIAEDEIDMVELIITIWKNKWKIILVTMLAIIITYGFQFNQQPAKSAFSTNTNIEPISTFDEFEYEVYNSFLNSIESKSILYTSIRDGKFDPYTEKKIIVSEDFEIYKIIDYSSFRKIDKFYLLDLFIDKLNENFLFIDAVKKFNLIKREDYQNNQAYEDALKKLASSIRLSKNDDKKIDIEARFWNIKYYTEDKEIWESFLKFIQESTNNEVQKYLSNSFNELIVNEKRLKNYKIEDINWEIQNNSGDIQTMQKLEGMKLKLLNNKDIQRLENLFAKTPIATQGKFTAASIRIQSTEYENLNKNKGRSLATKLYIAGLFGALLSVLFVLISDVVQNRRKAD
jgi:LPS O-antigen subunit length determinant protein (WzzB/FepE family)